MKSTKKLRSGLLIGIAAVAVTALVSACGSSPGGEQNGTVRIGWATYPSSPQIAQGAGFMKKHLSAVNASAKWFKFNSGSDLATALLSNKVDILTSVTAVPMIPLIARKTDFKIVYVTDSSINDDEIVAKDSIHSISDLVGKKVTYTSGTGQQYTFLTAAKVAGLSGKQFQNIDLPPQDGTAAILRGSVDAAALYQPYADKVAHTPGFHVLTTDAQLTKATNNGYRVADFVAVNNSYLKAHPKIVQAFVGALGQAAELYKSDPKKAANLSWKQDGAPSATQALSLLKTSSYPTLRDQTTSAYLGTPGHPGDLAKVIKNVADFEKEIGTVPNSISLTQVQGLLEPGPVMATTKKS